MTPLSGLMPAPLSIVWMSSSQNWPHRLAVPGCILGLHPATLLLHPWQLAALPPVNHYVSHLHLGASGDLFLQPVKTPDSISYSSFGIKLQYVLAESIESNPSVDSHLKWGMISYWPQPCRVATSNIGSGSSCASIAACACLVKLVPLHVQRL